LQPYSSIACVARAAQTARGRPSNPQFFDEYSKYSGWPEIKEIADGGAIQAATCWRRWSWIFPTERYPQGRFGSVTLGPVINGACRFSVQQHFRQLTQAHRRSQPLCRRFSVLEEKCWRKKA